MNTLPKVTREELVQAFPFHGGQEIEADLPKRKKKPSRFDALIASFRDMLGLDASAPKRPKIEKDSVSPLY